MKRVYIAAALAAIVALSGGRVQAGIRITEWMYNGSEFFELTNLGGMPVDMTGWSYDDDSRVPGTTSLSGFGIVDSGEVVVLAELPAAEFRTLWGIDPTVTIVGDNSNNLGRNDEINIFDATNTLVDRLTYGDSVFVPGSIRTENISGNPVNLGATGLGLAEDVKAYSWVLSSVADRYGSYQVMFQDGDDLVDLIANPGVNVVPEPTTCLLAAFSLSASALLRRRR